MEKKIIVTLVFLVICAFVQAQSTFDQKLKSLFRNTVPTIDSNELQKYIDANKKVILLDTREEKEYRVSHLSNAIFIEYSKNIEEQISLIEKNAIIVIYCSVGYRSERIGEKLIKMGYRNVRNLYGGIFQWKNEGGIVVNSMNNSTDSVHTYNKNWSQWLSNGIKVY